MDKIQHTIEGMLANAELLLYGVPLVLFGMLLAYAAGMRHRLLIAGAAVPIAIGSMVASAQVLGSLGIGAPLPVIGLAALVVAALVGVARWQLRLRRRTADVVPEQQAGWPAWAGATVGAGLGAAAWLPSISRIGGPAQNIDDIWHGFLAARIGSMDIVTASSMSPVLVDRSEPTTFYPYGLHLAAAAVRSFTGVTVPVALNVLWAVAVGVMLPFGVAAFMHVLMPERRWAAGYAAIFVSALQFFPYVIAGIQPYTVALALIPGVLALLLMTIRPGGAVAAFGLGAGAVGLLVTHPAAAVAFAVIGALVLVETVLRSRETIFPALVRLPATGLVVAALSWPFIRSEMDSPTTYSAAVYAEVSNVGVAVRQAIAFQTPWTPKASLLAVFVLGGLAACLARRLRGWSLAVGYLAFTRLYVGVITGQTWPTSFVKPWYGEWWRLFGVVALVASPLAGWGAAALHDAVVGLLPAARRRFAQRGVPAVAVAAALVVLASSLVVGRSVLSAQATVSGTWNPQRVTPDDMALFKELGRQLTDDETVLNNWEDGSGAMYAVAGARPLSPYAFSGDIGLQTVLENLAALRPQDCAWLKERNVGHALAKHKFLSGAPNPLIPGLTANTEAFKQTASGPTGLIFQVDRGFVDRCAAGAQA